jgi:lipopolysaccharide export system permease protein
MIIARYLSKEIAMAVVVTMLALMGLMAFFDLMAELDDVGINGYKYSQALGYVALNTPAKIYELIPIGVLIGSIYAMSQFAANSEFTAMRAAGLGRKEALLSITAIGACFAIFTFTVGELLTPPLERKAKELKGYAIGGVASLRSGAWIKDAVRDSSGAPTVQRFVNVAALSPDGVLDRLKVYEFDGQFRLKSILQAKQARFEKAGTWQLEEVAITRFKDPSAATNKDSGWLTSSQEQSPKYEWNSELTPDLFGVLALDPEKMSALNLFQYTKHLRENKQRADRYEIAMWRKFIYPFVCMVMLVLSLPFAYLNARAGGIGYKVSAGVMLGIAFHTLNNLFSHIGLLNTWPAWISASVPSLLATVLALLMLYWVDRA